MSLTRLLHTLPARFGAALAAASGAVVLAAVLGAAAVTSAHAAIGDKGPMRGPGDPRNDKLILVRGWSRAELEQIAHTFSRLYDVPPSYRLGAVQSPPDTLTVTFPGDIDPTLFLYLINYINYPKNFDLAGRTIQVLGKATLTPSFPVPELRLIGKPARIYVPAGDRDFNVVYLAVEAGGVYRNSFSEEKWQRVEDGRRPRNLEVLW